MRLWCIEDSGCPFGQPRFNKRKEAWGDNIYYDCYTISFQHNINNIILDARSIFFQRYSLQSCKCHIVPNKICKTDGKYHGFIKRFEASLKGCLRAFFFHLGSLEGSLLGAEIYVCLMLLRLTPFSHIEAIGLRLLRCIISV